MFFALGGLKKEEPEPEKPVENNTPVEPEVDHGYKLFTASEGGKDYELALYDDKTYLLYDSTNSTQVTAGTYVESEKSFDLTSLKTLTSNTCVTFREPKSIKAEISEDTVTINGIKYTSKDVKERKEVKSYEDNDATCTVEPEPEKPPVAVTKVTVDPTKKTIDLGKTVTIKAKIKPDDADDKTVTWTSSDNTIATVDENGTVTANDTKAGKATITAKASNGKSAKCTITVNDPNAKKEENKTTSDNKTADGTCKMYLYDNSLTKKDFEINGVSEVKLTAVRDKEGNSKEYARFKKNVVTETGTNAGQNAAASCKSLKEIIEQVKKYVKEVASNCWDTKYVNDAVDGAACLLTPGCSKPSYMTDDEFNPEEKKKLIISQWETHNCSLGEADYHL